MDFDNDGLGIATERGDVIGAWACFHIPDIFVEVDWMEGHEMSDEAVAKVVWAFARHGIALHIDRGEMGGGGQSITHVENVDTSYINSNYYNTNYFKSDRHHIFHYCVFVHSVSGDAVGMSDNMDVVIVGDAELSSITEKAHVFMHELGHDLINEERVPWYIDTDNKDGDNNENTGKDHNRYEGKLMYKTVNDNLDFEEDWQYLFTSSCWGG